MTTRLGQTVKDRISGFSGVVTGRTEYLFANVRVEVTPRVVIEGAPGKGQWFDEERLEIDESAELVSLRLAC